LAVRLKLKDGDNMGNNPGVVLVKPKNIIHVQSAFPIFPNFVDFSVIATVNGQTQFTLPSYPVLTGLFSCNINGVTQDPLNGDFTVNGNILTMNANLVIGDKIAGFYQQMSPNMNPSILSYRTFFFIAAQGQTSFSIGFVPNAIIYIAVNGVLQSTTNYTINGQIITLTGALNAGDNFFGLAII
jgi:hypothetical protein